MKLLSYIILFYVGFYFYRLAENHKKNKWLFGLIGILFYFLSVFIYLCYLFFFYSEELSVMELASVSLKSFLVGLFGVFILFQVLSFVWSRKKKIDKKEIDKIGK